MALPPPWVRQQAHQAYGLPAPYPPRPHATPPPTHIAGALAQAHYAASPYLRMRATPPSGVGALMPVHTTLPPITTHIAVSPLGTHLPPPTGPSVPPVPPPPTPTRTTVMPTPTLNPALTQVAPHMMPPPPVPSQLGLSSVPLPMPAQGAPAPFGGIGLPPQGPSSSMPVPLPPQASPPAPFGGVGLPPQGPSGPPLGPPPGSFGGGGGVPPPADPFAMPFPSMGDSGGGAPPDPSLGVTDSGVPGIPSPPSGIVLPSDVDQLKAQIAAKVTRIDGAIGKCPDGVVDQDAWNATKAAALAFANSSTLGGIFPGLLGGQGQDFPAQMAIGQGILAGLDGWEQTLAAQCGLAPPPPPQPVPSQQGGGLLGNAAQGIGTGLMGVGIAVAAVMAFLVLRR